MKQARRKELKTNELSIYLQQIQETVAGHANYIIGGVIVVVLILVVALYVRHNRYEYEALGWRQYRKVFLGSLGDPGPEVLDQARSLVSAYADDPKLGPLALELEGNIAYQRAMMLSPLSAGAERQDLLKTAQEVYQRAIDMPNAAAEVKGRARMGLAAVFETLAVAGQGSAAAAAEQYRKLTDSPAEPLMLIAQAELDTLPERMHKLEIVATRPAEPVATASATMPVESAATTTPAAATMPIITTAPAAVVVPAQPVPAPATAAAP